MTIYSHVGTIEGLIFLLFAFSLTLFNSSCTGDHSKKNRKNPADFILPKDSNVVRIADTVWDEYLLERNSVIK